MKEPMRTLLKEILIKTAYDYEMHIEEIEIPPDHIHMIIQAPPKFSPSKIMQILKSKSAIEFFKVYPKIKRAYFW
jgi:putative transposase